MHCGFILLIVLFVFSFTFPTVDCQKTYVNLFACCYYPLLLSCKLVMWCVFFVYSAAQNRGWKVDTATQTVTPCPPGEFCTRRFTCSTVHVDSVQAGRSYIQMHPQNGTDVSGRRTPPARGSWDQNLPTIGADHITACLSYTAVDCR